MIEHHLSVQRTARYYTIGELTDQTQYIWFCLHGFGQLARFFSQKFTALNDGKTFIVVPEALSRFYLTNDYKRIGASWQTREDRANEVNDFITYLNSLYTHILAQVPSASLPVTLFGFSQGAATACRWLNDGHIQISRLLLWAGYFPDGLNELINPAKLADIDVHYVYGDKDEYLIQLENQDEYIGKLMLDVPTLTITTFAGTHRVEPSVLSKLIKGE
ncbi:esterase [Spirosoma terrae]|uniref:Phospholipase n=1 Tax=Spirosoma terrae TaxID=1968276 RepID=A0A6L9LIR3_9BACT|nr:phospholipase [Spirosoma terrae]NDU99131.1 phospholipase [Spirosoma terrae]